MLNEQDLLDLIAYKPGDPVLSIYLNVDPSAGSADAYKLRLRQMLKEFEDRVPQDVETVLRFIDHEYDWSGRSLAIFSSANDRFFSTYALPLSIRDRTRLDNRPYVKPLADILDHYGYYGVVLVDRQGARIFHFHLGQLEEHPGTMGEEVRHTKRGGGSQARGRKGGIAGQTRYTEELAERNLREAADYAARFFQELRVRRILVGGTEANLSKFLSLLPKSQQSLVMGTFPMEMTAGHAQVLEKAMQVAQQTQDEDDDRLVTDVITAAAKGQDGVIGLDDALGAAHAGRIQTLLIHEGYREAGLRCKGCGFLTAHNPEQCPFCGGTMEHIADAVELTVRKVITDGGDVQVIHDNQGLRKAGNIAGQLRY